MKAQDPYKDKAAAISGFKCLNNAQWEEALARKVSPKLQEIIDRGSDESFTPEEEETFRLLCCFIKDESNSIEDRARAVYHYDSLMINPSETERRWRTHGPKEVVEEFLGEMEELR